MGSEEAGPGSVHAYMLVVCVCVYDVYDVYVMFMYIWDLLEQLTSQQASCSSCIHEVGRWKLVTVRGCEGAS